MLTEDFFKLHRGIKRQINDIFTDQVAEITKLNNAEIVNIFLYSFMDMAQICFEILEKDSSKSEHKIFEILNHSLSVVFQKMQFEKGRITKDQLFSYLRALDVQLHEMGEDAQESEAQ